MAVVATFSLPLDALPIGEALSLIDGNAEIERVVPIGGPSVPFAWVRGDAADELPAVASAIDRIDTLEPVDSSPDGTLYRLTHADTPAVIVALRTADVTLLEAVAHDDHWTVRLRADDARAISTFRDRCLDAGIEAVVTGLSKNGGSIDGRNDRLTDDQRVALTLAFEEGYYDHPRGTSLDDLGEQLGITRQAVAGRLRRAHRNLAADLLGVHDDR